MASLLTADEQRTSQAFLNEVLGRPQINQSTLLATIPHSSQPSYAPLYILSNVLSRHPSGWPLFNLLQIYTKFWKLLPEDAKAGRCSVDATSLLDQVSRQCKGAYTGLSNLLHSDSDDNAIIDPETSKSITHRQLRTLVDKFSLPSLGSCPSKPVVAVSIPNGALLALTVLAATTYYTVAPLAHGTGVGAQQFKTDVLQSKTNIVLAIEADVNRLGLKDSWLKDAGIQVFLVSLGDDMNLALTNVDGRPALAASHTRPDPNTADDIGIMLFTSGTSGTKKLVPLRVHSLVSGVAMVIESWGLTKSSRCLNQMPLNHVGGLVRNLFAPVMSGGSLIACSAYDAGLFWDAVEDWAPTWYYASPTMHQGYLQTGEDRPESVAKSRIQLVCNAAGGLLPSLACQIRDTFSNQRQRCIVLPSYGMTECMPISTPPLDYQLDRTGTSGISVGPEIAILDGNDARMPVGTIGRISVRGAPVFGGYLKNNDIIDTSCFNVDGFFDTGDLGYLDADGYLYITGRSKEVINRGGELISPFEVEEAIVIAASTPDSRIQGRISKALAFSVTHDTLQEVVGIAVVTPPGSKRACLRDIQESLKSSLGKVKIPVLVVYMDGGVPTNNNKVLRIKLADRLGLPEISDSTPQAERYYEAVCPPANTALSVPIECGSVSAQYHCLEEACFKSLPRDVDIYVRADPSGFYPDLVLAPKSPATPIPPVSQDTLITKLAEMLHGYNVPSKVFQLDQPFPRDNSGKIHRDEVNVLLHPKKGASAGNGSTSDVESKVAAIFAQILELGQDDISSASDFFDLGGDSMKAGRLLSLLRKEFQLRLPIDVLFNNKEVGSLALLIAERMPKSQPKQNVGNSTQPLELAPGCTETYSSSNPFVLFMQLLPIGLIFPMRRALTWTVFMYFLMYTQRFITADSVPGRLVNLVLSITIGRLVTKAVTPFVAIAFKWIVVGRYREGLYPMWGPYWCRWWITQKVIAIGGMGFFGLNSYTKAVYFRLLGAKIGKGVSLAKGITLGEYDLITIEDNAVLERCIVRPFAAERNTTMYLGRIHIGTNASVGLASIVAPGTKIPANACIGPNSSSWEAGSSDEGNRDLAASKIPKAHWALEYLIGFPIAVVTKFIGALPWLLCLVALVLHEPASSNDMLASVIQWFASPQRVLFHYVALVANFSLGPVFFFFSVLVVKKTFDLLCGGPLKPSSIDQRSNMSIFRSQLIRTLMPAKTLHGVSELLGSHYEGTSVLYRLMGAKVGQRVYWPGTGPSVQDYDQLEIGNDVVFGSRSHLVNSDGYGSEKVVIGDGAMIADRVVLLPGVRVGQATVMGSGALTKRATVYPPSTTWVGSKNNEAICLSQSAATAVPGPSNTVEEEITPLSSGQSTPKLPTSNFFSLNSSTTTLRPSGFTSETSSINDKSQPRFNEKDLTAVLTSTQDSENSEKPSLSPFGRAFYEGKAPYRVWGQFTIFCYSTLIIVVTATYWNVSSISALQIIARLFKDNIPAMGQTPTRPLTLYATFLGIIMAIMAVQTVLALAVIIAAKWILMGRRTQGNYDWDKSPYCQRWQLFLKIEVLRRNCYGGNGILGLLTGSWWIATYFRLLGANIGKDCALFAGGLPSLYFTEPDLLTLGDRVSVDDASLVGHVNSRGKFDLNPLYVGSRSVLRTGSRLLSGAKMEADTCLLEHTLVMAGDVVDAGCTYQGWPAEEFKDARIPTMKIVPKWEVA
ncbi:acetyl-CoA synthetase-like protein [Polychaeton citri CBS 116435]|uniref:Acetyl-CoA synthetase-like protein n=1 Tax=Polychaeton citri CBS 116435 TaxID=1314669 RepID=A0A9P4QF90_9PEZI|nr:acetyl-CoA synthetase-like protein [Polychaeton citri CBS 116435]